MSQTVAETLEGMSNDKSTVNGFLEDNNNMAKVQ